ncbi:MFS general substrate transporter [Yamadazyma tenuis ATCC 10573]|uniref:MFS general substrate transporter n=1 Tax=Candida tenuis (strain ATCC 10573 / BCRC 21748 / CBS 615 / JCM 9827 / NBRC 10315 / NRRL Y-1498 / VKM Y-70) TaxID=590646 RepID=G3B8U2_CANTC|nr:MFS general substrate transporter [Yamadazyma tenuis ATCC 10573]EGV62962.1 MFS general substrate transporter [Yamadazyma tenuis ATCC 10573]
MGSHRGGRLAAIFEFEGGACAYRLIRSHESEDPVFSGSAPSSRNPGPTRVSNLRLQPLPTRKCSKLHSTTVVVRFPMSSNEEYTPLLGGSLSERQSCDDDTHLEWYKIHLYLQHLQWYKRPNWVFINIVVFLYTLTSIGEPTRKTIRFKLACNSLIEDNGQCDRTKVQLLVSNFDQYSLVVSQFSSVLALATLGSLSNRYGRKPFLCLIPASIFVSRCLLLVSIVNNETFEMSTFLVCDVIASICGSQLGMLGIAKSYVTDIVHPSQRSNSLAFINGALYAGGTLGPMLSNLLSMWLAPDPISHTPNTFQHLSQREVYIQMVEIGLFSVIVVFVAVIVPESRLEHNEESEEPGLDLISPVKTLLRPIFSGNTGYQIRVLLVSLICVHSLMLMYEVGIGVVSIDYAVYMFGWDAKMVGVLLMVFGFTRVVVLYIIYPFLSRLLNKGSERHFDRRDFILVLTGLVFNVLLHGGLGSSRTSGEYLASIVVGSVSSIVGPTIQSIILKYFTKSQTSDVIMALSLVNGVCNIMAPLFFVNIYKLGLIHRAPALVYLVSGSIDVVVAVVFVVVRSFRSQYDAENYAR